MNIQDVDEKIEVPKTREGIIKAIFDKQEELAKKYKPIEQSQGIGYGLLRGKFDINESRSQYLLKDFAWRVTEELTEAVEAKDKGEKEHMLEEIADAFHFLVELCILVEIPSSRISRLDPLFPDPLSPKDIRIYCVIHSLGIAMNCLKQKPWKQTHVLTDTKKFENYIVLAFSELCRVWKSYEMTAESLYIYYFKKNKVNNFRIESNY